MTDRSDAPESIQKLIAFQGRGWLTNRTAPLNHAQGASTSVCDAWAESSFGPFCTLTHHEKTRESGKEADDSEHHSASIHCFNNTPSCALTSTSSADTLPSAGYICSAARPASSSQIIHSHTQGAQGEKRLSERTLITYRAGLEQRRLRLSKTIVMLLDAGVCIHTGEQKLNSWNVSDRLLSLPRRSECQIMIMSWCSVGVEVKDVVKTYYTFWNTQCLLKMGKLYERIIISQNCNLTIHI